ncbi:cell wall hydrolase [Tsuneonella sp. HG249]
MRDLIRAFEAKPAPSSGLLLRRPGAAIFALSAVVAVAIIAWVLVAAQSRPAGADLGRAAAGTDFGSISPGSVIFDQGTLPIAPQEAKALNDARPVDIALPQPARPFGLTAGDGTSAAYAAALQCLAQAVFYEAGNQTDAGARAVAQVVLNRVRHPAFPHTVCGVVYQGSARATGCQFTFTCDGSLSRRPSAQGFARARRIAREALEGTVYPDVGLATHYHADYVVPYWASSLAKVGREGAHLFYQLRGRLGAIASFDARYDLEGELASAPGWTAGEDALGVAIPAIEGGTAAQPVAALPRLRSDAEAGDLIADPRVLAEDARRLRADEVAGSLKAGGGSELLADRQQPKGR